MYDAADASTCTAIILQLLHAPVHVPEAVKSGQSGMGVKCGTAGGAVQHQIFGEIVTKVGRRTLAACSWW